jgi:hypothetical protein
MVALELFCSTRVKVNLSPGLKPMRALELPVVASISSSPCFAVEAIMYSYVEGKINEL